MEHERRHDSEEINSLRKMVDDHRKILDSIQKTLESMDSKLEPIADTYRTARTVGKWVMGLLVFVSVVIGILVEIKKFFSIK